VGGGRCATRLLSPSGDGGAAPGVGGRAGELSDAGASVGGSWGRSVDDRFTLGGRGFLDCLEQFQISATPGREPCPVPTRTTTRSR
jgi:hypothetical protein